MNDDDCHGDEKTVMMEMMMMVVMMTLMMTKKKTVMRVSNLKLATEKGVLLHVYLVPGQGAISKL